MSTGPGKTVPLTMYVQGERHEIGRATVDDATGEIKAYMYPEHRDVVEHQRGMTYTEFSLGYQLVLEDPNKE